MKKPLMLLALGCAALLAVAPAHAQAGPRDVDLTARDGVKLKGTFFSAGKPGPAVMLFHQCNRDRTAWAPLAAQLAQAGVNVLTMDNRGFGGSGGDRYASLTLEQREVEMKVWAADFDIAYQYLLAQPGVDKARIGAGGASCGVDNVIQLARRHPGVRTLVLLSGTTDNDGIKFLESAANIPLLISASEDDGGMLPYMRWLMAFSTNPQDKLVGYKAAGHGTEMFKVEKGLEPMILDWYVAKLERPPAPTSAKNPAKRSAIPGFWDALNGPDGPARATKMFEEAKRKDPDVFLFPELVVNLLGYEHLQAGDTKGAIEILKLNELAYPRSANVYDSLGDAYLADGQNELALECTEITLKVLAENPPENAATAQALRESAEGRLRKLGPQ